MDDLEDRWDKLQLTEEENAVIDLNAVHLGRVKAKGDKSLVGKLISDRKVNKEVIRSTMNNIWRLAGSFTFHDILPNLFVVTFDNQKDKQRVLDGKPWLFDNQLLLLKPFDGFTLPQKMNFDYEAFWVHLNNLPLACMNLEVGTQIGKTIGNVKEVDVREDGIGWGRYLRVKIELDLRKSIARGRTANVLGSKIWVPLSYEKLPKICFKCGRLVHGAEGCVGLDGRGGGSQYGTWLRTYHTDRGNITENNRYSSREGCAEEEREFNRGSMGKGGMSKAGYSTTPVDEVFEDEMVDVLKKSKGSCEAKKEGADKVFVEKTERNEIVDNASREGMDDAQILATAKEGLLYTESESNSQLLLQNEKGLCGGKEVLEKGRWKRRARIVGRSNVKEASVGGKRSLRGDFSDDSCEGISKKSRRDTNEGDESVVLGLAEAASSKRKGSWKLLSLLKPSPDQPWCIIGDFNEVVCQAEKMGGKPRSETQMEEFRKVLEENCIFDLGWKGSMYTWSNKYGDNTFTKERLDRAVANHQWSESFKFREVEVLPVAQSDHKALLLYMRHELIVQKMRRRVFRFEAKWIRDEEGELVVDGAWKRWVAGDSFLKRIQGKLLNCQGDLTRWSSRRHKDFGAAMKQKTERLKFELDNEGPHNIELIKQLQGEMGLLLEQEDLKWRQRAKRIWYQLGDKNTKFFHSCASQRRRKNQIKELLNSQGSRVTKKKEIEEVFYEYFNGIFCSTQPSRAAIEA
ncbi:uncharacterized protein LOC122275977 [Carya illinoinensis]|uniref:uncharacterized protein LOC122275977 n=1 Tax=Carya illinoinensis TaxID=32201 RepID=UPI001C724E37|nr:uncharacterized protein LOC122275977 [Carya illinoinensis]